MHMGDTGDTNDKNTVVTFELLFLNQGQGAGQSLAQACLLLKMIVIHGYPDTVPIPYKYFLQKTSQPI